ncbi:MAG: chloramphenicol acetyltransferase [Pseudomonadota bacterium]
MARLKADTPFIGPGASVTASELGRFVEVGEGARLAYSTLGDYSYCDRYADIANASIGKFCNIASFARIGPTDHPMERASLHHFMYRSADLWDDAENDTAFFDHRRSRRIEIGHDTWIGHGAVIRPEITVGHGAVVGAMAVVTKDVAPYTVVVGSPAKVMRRRHSERTAERLIALAWWDWSHDRIRAALDNFRANDAEAFLEMYEGRSAD